MMKGYRMNVTKKSRGAGTKGRAAGTATPVNKNKTPVNRTSGAGVSAHSKASGFGLPASGSRGQSEESRIASLESQNASLESQITAMEKQIAFLQASDSGLQASGPEVRSLKPEVRSKLAAPTNLLATPFGSGFLRVSWNAVVGAKGYLVQYSSDSSFVNDTKAVMVDAPGASVTLGDLKPDTMYHVKVKSIADTGDTDSDFSMAYLVRTGMASDDVAALHLESWLADQQTMFDHVTTLVPQLGATELSSRDRMRLNGSGVRRYGFIEKTADVAEDFPQFWPGLVGSTEKLNNVVHEIEVLRNLLVWFRFAARAVQDLLLIAGDDAFRLAGSYYATARDWARRKNPEAQQVFHMLNLFWQRARRPSEEPTNKQVEHDVHGLLNGTKEGEVTVRNEGDHVTKGKRTVIDKTRKVPKGKRRRNTTCYQYDNALPCEEIAEFGELGDELSAVE